MQKLLHGSCPFGESWKPAQVVVSHLAKVASGGYLQTVLPALDSLKTGFPDRRPRLHCHCFFARALNRELNSTGKATVAHHMGWVIRGALRHVDCAPGGEPFLAGADFRFRGNQGSRDVDRGAGYSCHHQIR